MNIKRHKIIFDFDGTIADSLKVFIDTAQIVTKQKKDISEDQIEELRKSTLLEIINILEIKKWQIPNLIINGRKIMKKRITEIKLFDGMKEILEELTIDHDVYILSSNSSDNIQYFLKKYELESIFTSIYSDVPIWGKSSSLRKFCKRESMKIADCVYIGDEIRDIEAAKRVKIKFISVGWGFINPDTLSKYKPQILINEPKELIAAISLIDRSV
jgi:phosphoglycolate phosphatase